MDSADQVGKPDQREEHSLPGTNQAGKGPSSLEHDLEKKPNEEEAQPQEQIDKHSLPGTNQAGKGPRSPKKDDRTAR